MHISLKRSLCSTCGQSTALPWSRTSDEPCLVRCRAMIMNVNEPETRGVALALHVVLDDLGKGVGPALVAVLITALGRQLAFSLSIAGWVPCGLLIRECSHLAFDVNCGKVLV